jgi:chromosome segregation ATPase
LEADLSQKQREFDDETRKLKAERDAWIAEKSELEKAIEQLRTHAASFESEIESHKKLIDDVRTNYTKAVAEQAEAMKQAQELSQRLRELRSQYEEAKVSPLKACKLLMVDKGFTNHACLEEIVWRKGGQLE